MDTITTIIGILALAHGVFWGAMRLVRPDKFHKIHPWANRPGLVGSAMYPVCFILVPLAAGALLTVAGLQGFSLLDSLL